MMKVRLIIRYKGVIVNELIFSKITSALIYVHHLILIDKETDELETYDFELKLIK